MELIIKEEELTQLAGARDGIRLSLYLPTYRQGSEVQQNPIRYKNLLQEADARQWRHRVCS